METKVLEQLKSVFKTEYIGQDVQPKVARLIADLLNCTSSQRNPSTGYIVDSIMVEDIMIVLKQAQKEYSIEQQLDFMLLYANLSVISNTIRGRIVQIGGVERLVFLAETMQEKGI